MEIREEINKSLTNKKDIYIVEVKNLIFLHKININYTDICLIISSNC
jgi:hypothetical protein